MFAALSWLLDLNPAQSSSSSTADSVSYQHSRSSSRSHSTNSSNHSHNTNAPHTVVPPTTFTDARGEAVLAELHVSSTATAALNNAADAATATAKTSSAKTRAAGQGLSISVQGFRRDTQQRDDSLFADLQAQGSTFFANSDNRDEITYSAASPHTVPVWNLSTYTSDTVSISPLPSPSYGQAPTNPSAAFYSLAEHGTAVVTPPFTYATAATTTSATTNALAGAGGRTLWASEGVVLSARFPSVNEDVPKAKSGLVATAGAEGASAGITNDVFRSRDKSVKDKDGGDAAAAGVAQAERRGKKTRSGHAAASAAPPIVVVEARRGIAAATDALKDVPPALSAKLQAKQTTTAGAAPNVDAAAHTLTSPTSTTTTTAAAVLDAGLRTAVGEADARTPATRIVEWDQEVHDGRREFLLGDEVVADEDALNAPAIATAEPSDAEEIEEGEHVPTYPSSALHVAVPSANLVSFQHQRPQDARQLPPAASPGDHVVQLRPTNPFLLSNTDTATTLPTFASAQRPSDVAARAVGPAAGAATGTTVTFDSHTSFAPPPPPPPVLSVALFTSSSITKEARYSSLNNDDGTAVPMVSFGGAVDALPAADEADPFAFMRHTLLQRTEEFLMSQSDAKANNSRGDGSADALRGHRTGKPDHLTLSSPLTSPRADLFASGDVPAAVESSDAIGHDVVELGDGLVTLTAMEVNSPYTPPRRASTAAVSRGKPVFDFS